MLLIMLDSHSVPARNMTAVHVLVMVVDWEVVGAVVIVPVRQQVTGRVDCPVIVMTATCHHVTGTGDKII